MKPLSDQQTAACASEIVNQLKKHCEPEDALNVLSIVLQMVLTMSAPTEADAFELLDQIYYENRLNLGDNIANFDRMCEAAGGRTH